MNEKMSISMVETGQVAADNFQRGLLINFTIAEVRARYGENLNEGFDPGPFGIGTCLDRVLGRFGTYLITEEAKKHIITLVSKELGLAKKETQP